MLYRRRRKSNSEYFKYELSFGTAFCLKKEEAENNHPSSPNVQHPRVGVGCFTKKRWREGFKCRHNIRSLGGRCCKEKSKGGGRRRDGVITSVRNKSQIRMWWVLFFPRAFHSILLVTQYAPSFSSLEAQSWKSLRVVEKYEVNYYVFN